MLFAALGCNLAWGDYRRRNVFDGSSGRARTQRLGGARHIRREDAHRNMISELPPLLAPAFQATQLEAIRERPTSVGPES
jgi:hypothetical protein